MGRLEKHVLRQRGQNDHQGHALIVVSRYTVSALLIPLTARSVRSGRADEPRAAPAPDNAHADMRLLRQHRPGSVWHAAGDPPASLRQVKCRGRGGPVLVGSRGRPTWG
jgi:hypothetical protein